MFLENTGYCPICSSEATFSSKYDWLRDHYICARCGSIPRERALMVVLETHYPDWRNLHIHESSPAGRGVSPKLAKECAGYLPTWFYPEGAPGSIIDGNRCENLEALTFGDQAFDLHITQDVMEHVFNPAAAFREISRTLKPGGVISLPFHSITSIGHPAEERSL
jgi:SAM-dependent methyltransferase